MALVLQRPKWNGDLWPSDYIETRKRIHWKGGLSQWVLWTLLQSWASASPAFVPDTHSAKIITRHKNNRPSLANWTVIFNQLSMWTNRLSVALFFYNHISTHVWKCQKFSSFSWLLIFLISCTAFSASSVFTNISTPYIPNPGARKFDSWILEKYLAGLIKPALKKRNRLNQKIII